MTSIRNSKLFGTKADYYGDIIISGVSEAESKIANYCPTNYQSEGIYHSHVFNNSIGYGFIGDYTIRTITNNAFTKDHQTGIFSDKNAVFSQTRYYDLATATMTLISGNNPYHAIMDDGYAISIGYNYNIMKINPYSGDTETITSGSSIRSPFYLPYNHESIMYFKRNGKEYLAWVTGSVSTGYFNLYNYTDNILTYKSFTKTFKTRYLTGNNQKTFQKYFLYKNHIVFLYYGLSSYDSRWDYYNIINYNIDTNTVLTSSSYGDNYSDFALKPIAIDYNEGYIYWPQFSWPSTFFIARYNISTNVFTSDYMKGIPNPTYIEEVNGVLQFDNRVLIQSTQTPNSKHSLWDASLGYSGLVATDLTARVTSSTACEDNYNIWCWRKNGDDLCAYDLNGDIQYTIEDVCISDTGYTSIFFQHNKFIITNGDSTYGYVNKIIYWDIEQEV